MHHLAVKSNLVDSGPERNKIGSGGNDLPLCPKPRQLPPAVPEFLKPLRCNNHSQPHIDGRRGGVLSLITEEKNTDVKEPVCSGCSPCCYSGSPPGRTENPLVHDVQFLHQMELFSPFTRTKLSDDKFGITSASPI